LNRKKLSRLAAMKRPGLSPEKKKKKRGRGGKKKSGEKEGGAEQTFGDYGTLLSPSSGPRKRGGKWRTKGSARLWAGRLLKTGKRGRNRTNK